MNADIAGLNVQNVHPYVQTEQYTRSQLQRKVLQALDTLWSMPTLAYRYLWVNHAETALAIVRQEQYP